MKKAIVLGYHEIGCILLDELKRNNIKVSLIVGDYSKHDNQTNSWYRDIRKIAQKRQIKILERKNLKQNKIRNLIKKIKPNIIFSAYTNFILDDEIINIPNLGCYNFHNSDLPKDRGRGAPIFTISKGRKETALTMHHIISKIDAGDIVDKEKVFIEKDDDIKRLYLKHNFALKKILDRQLIKLKKYKLKGYAQKKTKEKINLWIEGKSDFISFTKMTSNEIKNKVNALRYPFKGAKCSIDDKEIFLHDVEIYRKKTVKNFKPGQVIKIDQYDVIVQTKKGRIKIKELSQNKRHMLPSHFFLENKINKSKRFI